MTDEPNNADNDSLTIPTGYIPAGLLWRIMNAGFAPRVQTLAIHLLLRTPSESNCVALTRQELMTITGDDNWDTARMKLTPLRGARLGHITTNEHVYVTWWDENGGLHPAFGRVENQSPTRIEYSPTRTLCAPVIGKVRVDAQNSNHLAPIDISINHIDIDMNEQDDVMRSLKLLTDPEVGFSTDDARKLMIGEGGRIHRFEWLERQVFTWLGQEKKYGLGGLMKRIQSKWSASALTWMDERSDLWNRVHSDEFTDDTANCETASNANPGTVTDSAEPDQPTTDPAPTVTEPDPPAAPVTEQAATPSNDTQHTNVSTPPASDGAPININTTWSQVLTKLETSVPASTFNAWVRDTQPLAFCEHDGIIVGVPNAYTQDWLHNRLRPMIKRTITGITGQAIDVRFQVAQKVAT